MVGERSGCWPETMALSGMFFEFEQWSTQGVGLRSPVPSAQASGACCHCHREGEKKSQHVQAEEKTNSLCSQSKETLRGFARPNAKGNPQQILASFSSASFQDLEFVGVRTSLNVQDYLP